MRGSEQLPLRFMKSLKIKNSYYKKRDLRDTSHWILIKKYKNLSEKERIIISNNQK
jgi:hypothetical protein